MDGVCVDAERLKQMNDMVSRVAEAIDRDSGANLKTIKVNWKKIEVDGEKVIAPDVEVEFFAHKDYYDTPRY